MIVERPTPVWEVGPFADYMPQTGVIRDHVEYGIRCTDAPPLFHITSGTAIVGGAVSGNLNLSFEGQEHPLNMYWLNVGPSSESRKSSSIMRAVKMASPIFAPLGERIWFPTASSPEGILEGLATNKVRLAVLSEWTELHGMSAASYWKHSTDLWNRLYDAVDIHRKKAKETISIENPRVSILGASTPSLIEGATTLHDWLAGKMARYVIAPAVRPADREMDAAIDDPDAVARLRAQLTRLTWPTHFSRAALSPEAWRLFRSWRRDSKAWKDMQARAPKHLIPSFGRAQEHVFRIATLYEASIAYPDPVVVSPANMQAAINLMMWCTDATIEHLGVLNDRDQNPVARTVGVLQAAGGRGLTRSELLRRTRLSTRQMAEVLETLLQSEEIVVGKRTSKGRPAEMYRYVNPDAP